MAKTSAELDAEIRDALRQPTKLRLRKCGTQGRASGRQEIRKLPHMREVQERLNVPVHATGDDGVTYGMFIGEDCAKKFFDIKLRRENDSIVES